MPLTIRSVLVLAALCSSLLPARNAGAQQNARKNSAPPSAAGAACVRAYEQAQEQRQSGKLLQARGALESCARDECPGFIRSDCVAWYGEVQSELPTVVFAARSEGRDLADVRVSAGQRVLTSRVDGKPIELDPGEYDLEFSALTMQSVRQHVVVLRGERNRLLRVELVPLQRPHSSIRAVAPEAERAWLLPGIFGGVAVLGLSSFGAFGAWGRSAESKLESTCSPRCSPDQISGVRTKYLIADVSLGMSVASLGLAAWLALSAGGEQRAAHSSPLDVRASTDGLRASYRGAF
jgi:hypothetical protein